VSSCLARRILLELILPENLNLNKDIRISSSCRENLGLKGVQCSEEERQYTETALGALGPQAANRNKTRMVGKQKLEFPCATLPVLPDFPHTSLPPSYLYTKHSQLPVTVLSLHSVRFQGAGFGVSQLPQVSWNVAFICCHVRL